MRSGEYQKRRTKNENENLVNVNVGRDLKAPVLAPRSPPL